MRYHGNFGAHRISAKTRACASGKQRITFCKRLFTKNSNYFAFIALLQRSGINHCLQSLRE
ncbi:MAG: hypothetical protein ACO3NE_04555, partial [Alphaproteobacteria bacterium]